ncbi:putative DNA-binding domain-containing protein [Herbaspirillum sp. RTI4]|uniref:HvfC/BufC family peptide modification chaperone n=1 Tax=Herbaspirillum sp. RTI4 TaxID=3048640 RepID=UPI002AB344FB|nr:putative DNA-binding domain-containing protein [Herbaspirillum sp. RTI4]MDY7577804.1 putative DNA-binding domain-containing protein [Herbaspirillum sp. RTI4]MEA9980768.1 putative DNA-binding domain-containing protein [Herbaspirillum sp. RTI4]
MSGALNDTLSHTLNDALSNFQDQFIRALYGETDVCPEVAALISQPGFKVYQNTVIKACVDALAANYPTIVQLVGIEWFHGAALIHVRAAPPTNVSMMEYGQHFPHFLAEFPPAAELPYLAEVARLDRLWIEAHSAADQMSLDATAFAGLSPEAIGRLILPPHPSARWSWCATQPAYSIWQANREQREVATDLAWVGEGALLTRRDGGVCWESVSAGACAFLDACLAGLTLEEAANRAVQADPAQDIASLLSQLITAGAFGKADSVATHHGD